MVSRGSFLEGGLNRFLKLELVLLLEFDTKVSIPAANKKIVKENLERILSGFNDMLSIHRQGLVFMGFGQNIISSLE
jgi:hypothetical protein